MSAAYCDDRNSPQPLRVTSSHGNIGCKQQSASAFALAVVMRGSRVLPGSQRLGWRRREEAWTLAATRRLVLPGRPQQRAVFAGCCGNPRLTRANSHCSGYTHSLPLPFATFIAVADCSCKLPRFCYYCGFLRRCVAVVAGFHGDPRLRGQLSSVLADNAGADTRDGAGRGYAKAAHMQGCRRARHTHS